MDASTREKVSVFIITKNEEEKIERCLRSVSWADEIIVLDSYSTDQTREIAKKYTRKVYKKEFKGYGPQKQAAIERCTNRWILEVDADEIVTEALKQEISRVQNNGEINKYAAYKIMRQEYFLRKPLMKSEIIRLYRKECVQYGGDIHEKLIVRGRISKLKSKIEHESDKYETIAKRVEKINLYTKKEAESRIQKKQWTTKGAVAGMLVMPIIYFIWFYGRKMLICKGYRGFIWSLLAGYYHFLIYAKIYEHIYKMKNNTREEDNETN